jgi:hypothetical protein
VYCVVTTQLNSNQLNSNQLNSNQLNSNQLNSNQLTSTIRLTALVRKAMGRYWQVACPDRQQQLTTLAWGKLGCILPDGYAGYHLQQQLMVPMRKQ